MNRFFSRSLFIPRYRFVIILTIVNIILLSTSFMVENIISINQIQTAGNDTIPISGTFNEFGGNLYFLSSIMHEINGSKNVYGYQTFYTKTDYYLNIFTQNNKLISIKFLSIDLQRNSYDNGNFTMYTFNLGILSSNQIAVTIKESGQVVYTDNNDLNRIIFAKQFTSYFMYLFQLNNLNSISNQKLVKLNFPENFTVDNIICQDSVYNILLTNPTNNSINFGTIPVQNSILITSSNLTAQFQNIINSNNYPIINLNTNEVRMAGSSLSKQNTPIFDLASNLHISSQTKIFQINMYWAHIYLIDSQQRVHIIGRSYLADNSGGNYTGLNSPNYVMVDLKTDKSYYWQIYPSTANKLVFMTPILFTIDSKVIIYFETNDINNFYNDSRKWDLSPNFNDSIVKDWDSLFHSQIAVFDPANPTPNNYIQFNQTTKANITYPRLYHTTPISFSIMSGIDNQLYGYTLTYTHTFVKSQITSASFQLFQNKIGIIGDQIIIGPKQAAMKQGEVSGWNIGEIFYVFNRKQGNNVQTFFITTATLYTHNIFLRGLNSHKTSSLMIMEIK